MSWKVEFIILIIISTLVDYFSALQISKSQTKSRKKFFLTLSLFVNLGLLFTFKYFNFFSDALRDVLALFTIQLQPATLQLFLPIGISFYTFQTLSYTIDVYRGNIKVEKHLGIFAVYVSFFPQLVAGPIEKGKNLLPQFYKKVPFDYFRITNGLKLMFWGFFKKIVIADQVAIVVNTIYSNPADFSAIPLILATVLFAFQIYCDFSGYSDIAIGSSQVLGIKLMDNFRRPYFARSIANFWQRWHISLYKWFRDYVYIPLGGNQVSHLRNYLNIFIVFLLSGLWHGASWTFILWGMLHAFYLIFASVTKSLRTTLSKFFLLHRFEKIRIFWQISLTFALVNLAWVLFRANSVADALYIFKTFFLNFSFEISNTDIGTDVIGLIIIFASILFMELLHLLQEHNSMRKFFSAKPIYQRWIIYLFIIMAILLFGSYSQEQFIYFQF